MPSPKTTTGPTGRLAAASLALAALLGACTQPVPPPETSGELRVGARNSPTTYYIGHDGEPAGFEHDLIRAFAQSQNWSVTWSESGHLTELFEQVDSHQIHMAAAALPQAVVRDRHLIAGPVLFETPVHIVYRRGERAPRNVPDLAGKRLALISGSGHTAILMRQKRKHPGLEWETLEHVWPEELLARLRAGTYDAVAINGMEFDALRNFYPDLEVAFDIGGDTQKIVWALPKQSSQAMRNALARFVEQARKDGTVAQIYERYFGHVRRLDRSDVLGIMERHPKLLPPLRAHFHEAQTLTGIDWRLLAAIGYQESQWNPYATSPTGVRGLMMLTTQTADRMGVANRLDARQSILGGARYLALLKEALPARIAEPDRTWLALAAYNQGQGHMEDARRIAQARGGNPDRWADVKEALPYLSRGTYAKVTRYGYARGVEALHFAENIRNYYDILQRLEPRFDPMINLGRKEEIAAPG
jgi:membrane-bound lytic murein transglycosylase F